MGDHYFVDDTRIDELSNQMWTDGFIVGSITGIIAGALAATILNAAYEVYRGRGDI